MRLRALVDKFGKGLNVTAQVLETAVQQSMQDLRRDAAARDLRSADGFLARVALGVKAGKPGRDKRGPTNCRPPSSTPR
jgi:hypothetical protein